MILINQKLNYMKKLHIITFLLAVLIMGSCKKSFIESLQNNPNTPSTGVVNPPNLILPPTLTNLAIASNSYGVNTSYEPGRLVRILELFRWLFL